MVWNPDASQFGINFLADDDKGIHLLLKRPHPLLAHKFFQETLHITQRPAAMSGDDHRRAAQDSFGSGGGRGR